MTDIYTIVAGVNLIACLGLALLSRAKKSEDAPAGFAGHLTRYLVAWFFCIAGEWLGGPGVYALYASYGLDRLQIAQIFVLGFAWSSVMGLFAGNFADRFGRKRALLCYCAVGVAAVCCRHVAFYPVLLVGLFFDGVHASLLYTGFESWLCSEHFNRHSFPPAFLGYSFSLMFSLSYLTAVCCGLIAQLGVNMFPALVSPCGYLHIGGWAVPYEMSAFMQILGAIYIALNWEENYGSPSGGESSSTGVFSGIGQGIRILFTDVKVAVCCIVVSCFESSMFIFVFSWTPALSAGFDATKLPCGLIFATYMMAAMSGAAVFTMVGSKFRITTVLLAVLALATVGMAVPAIAGISQETSTANFLGFLLFEFCVGIYFPAVGTMKSEFVGEECRTTIYNLFRTPMNAIVIVVLLTGVSVAATFKVLFISLLFATVVLGTFCAKERRVNIKQEPLLG